MNDLKDYKVYAVMTVKNNVDVFNLSHNCIMTAIIAKDQPDVKTALEKIIVRSGRNPMDFHPGALVVSFPITDLLPGGIAYQEITKPPFIPVTKEERAKKSIDEMSSYIRYMSDKVANEMEKKVVENIINRFAVLYNVKTNEPIHTNTAENV